MEQVATTTGRKGFFAVDQRSWHLASGLGVDAAVAYLFLAGGTQKGNRYSSWSVTSIERHTRISRGRANAAIGRLEEGGLIRRLTPPGYKKPRYEILPAHLVPNCERYPPALSEDLRQAYDDLLTCGGDLPPYGTGNDWNERRFQLDQLVELGCLAPDGPDRYVSTADDEETATRPDWIWLPNSLREGQLDKASPLDRLWAFQDRTLLRMFVNLYRSHDMDRYGGLSWRDVYRPFERVQFAARDDIVVWGFRPGPARYAMTTHFIERIARCGERGLVAHAVRERAEQYLETLTTLGLIEMVEHVTLGSLSHTDPLHPMPGDERGENWERDLTLAARGAAQAILNSRQRERGRRQGLVLLAPIDRTLADVQMVGALRLCHRPDTKPFATSTSSYREAQGWQGQYEALAERYIPFRRRA